MEYTPGSIPGPVSSTSKTMTISLVGAVSVTLSRENEPKLRRRWPLESGLVSRPRTKIRPLEVNLMLLPNKFVKTCIVRAESPTTILGTSSEAFGAIDFSATAYYPNIFLVNLIPKILAVLSATRNLQNSNLKVTQQQVQSEPYESCSQSVRPSPASQIAVTSCHDYPLTSSAPDGGCRLSI